MDRYDGLKLDHQLCFPLYASSREVIKQYHPHLEALGLTYTQYLTLLVIWEEKTISVRDLGRKLHLDSGTLTLVVRHLEQKGLITRRRWEKDERVLMVTITGEGLKLRDEARHIPGVIAQNFPLDAGETAQLMQLLNKLLENIE